MDPNSKVCRNVTLQSGPQFFALPQRVAIPDVEIAILADNEIFFEMVQSTCMPATFNTLTILDAEILSTSAFPVFNHTTLTLPFSNPNHGYIPPSLVSFCNLTVTHTHIGHNESILTRVYLPLSSWNGRLQGLGGGGFIAGLSEPLAGFDGAIAEGYAAVGTNSGLYTTDVFGSDSYKWALTSRGHINMHQVEDFAYRSLEDMVLIGKSAIEVFYGISPTYSYFSGCSGGGRQGYVYAQRYPSAWDGIAACAPSIYWDQLPDQYWAQLLMVLEDAYPWPCELIHLREKALVSCDRLDGVEDGVLQDPDDCRFNPTSLLGERIECPEAASKEVSISEIAVKIADLSWKNKRLEGLHSQMPTSGYDAMLEYLANTVCVKERCRGDPNPLAVNWMKIFVEKNLDWDAAGIKSVEELEMLRQRSVSEYADVHGITSYDLSGFRENGGKMIAYQGMSDFAVSYKTTQRFYDNVHSRDPSVHDYYRLFMAPGLEHTAGGRGAYPHTTFHALVNWVEKGIAPDTLEAMSAPDETGNVLKRRLCAYPKKSRYDGVGNPNEFRSWICV